MPILIFADGASSGNPGPGGWGSIIVLPEGEVIELGGREAHTTNNRMELMGVIAALRKIAAVPGEVQVLTDSVYVIRGITEWRWAWSKRQWKTAEGGDVANTDLWKDLIRVVSARGKENPIEWGFVRGHVGVPGNERVDEIAVAFSKGKHPALYQGPLMQYGIAIHDIPENTNVPDSARQPRAAKPAAFSYVSVVNGVPMRHATWPECEARVKGRPAAKFKRTASASDEASILDSWGFKVSQIK